LFVGSGFRQLGIMQVCDLTVIDRKPCGHVIREGHAWQKKVVRQQPARMVSRFKCTTKKMWCANLVAAQLLVHKLLYFIFDAEAGKKT
jgi:hypothetical protein